MSKVIDLTGLSRAITKIKEWVNGILDWNAQEGQDGYIRNKPFYIEQININKNGIVWDDMNGSGTIQLSQLGTITICFNDPSEGIFGPLILNEQNEYRGEISAPDSGWKVYLNTDNFVLTFIDTMQSGGGIVSITQDIFIKQLDEKYIPDTIARQSEITRVENDFKQKLAKKANDPTFRMYYLDRSRLRDRMTHAELNACFEGNELDDLLTNCWDSIIPVALRVTYGSYRGTTLYVTKSVYNSNFSEEDAEAGYRGTEGCSEVIFGSLVGIDESGLHAIRFAWDFAEHIWYVSIYED